MVGRNTPCVSVDGHGQVGHQELLRRGVGGAGGGLDGYGFGEGAISHVTSFSLVTPHTRDHTPHNVSPPISSALSFPISGQNTPTRSCH